MSEQTGEPPASPALAELERVAQARRERDGLRTQVDVVRQRLEQERAAASADMFVRWAMVVTEDWSALAWPTAPRRGAPSAAPPATAERPAPWMFPAICWARP